MEEAARVVVSTDGSWSVTLPAKNSATADQRGAESMQRVLPIYLAVDTTASMSTRLQAVQEAIISLVDELLSSPALGDQVRVGIVAFADRAELVLPLTDLTELRSLPRLTARGATQFGPLFRQLTRVIEHDLRVLRARDTITFQPFVFLITDGLPVDPNWEKAFQEFDDRTRAQLVILGIGLDGTSTTLLQRLRPVAIYTWEDDHVEVLAARIFTVLSDFAQSLVRSVQRSTGRDAGELQMPPPYRPLRESDIR
jgi:uncharacterized protein YegL